jgi:hypothetical protein
VEGKKEKGEEGAVICAKKGEKKKRLNHKTF